MQDNAPKPTLREEQRALTRRRLLDAAAEEFARQGYRGASVEAIARRAGATSGALYANFDSKEALFLALFEEWIAVTLGDYGKAAAGADPGGQARAGADHWMEVLRDQPTLFPLLIEFWSSAQRDSVLRDRLARHFAVLRRGMGEVIAEAAARSGVKLDDEATDQMGLFVNALGHGIALEKLLNPEAVPDALFGDLLDLIFRALIALSRGQRADND